MSKKYVLSSLGIFVCGVLILTLFMVIYKGEVVESGARTLHTVELMQKSIVDNGKEIIIEVEVENNLKKPVFVKKIYLDIPNNIDEKINISGITHVREYEYIEGNSKKVFQFKLSKKLMEVVERVEDIQIFIYVKKYKHTFNEIGIIEDETAGWNEYIDLPSLNLNK